MRTGAVRGIVPSTIPCPFLRYARHNLARRDALGWCDPCVYYTQCSDEERASQHRAISADTLGMWHWHCLRVGRHSTILTMAPTTSSSKMCPGDEASMPSHTSNWRVNDEVHSEKNLSSLLRPGVPVTGLAVMLAFQGQVICSMIPVFGRYRPLAPC